MLSKNGQIAIIFGPMYAGKSTALLNQLNVYNRCYKTAYVTHSIDNRHYLSHNPCISKNLEQTSIAYIQCPVLDTAKLSQYDVIGIDEAQFFDELTEPVIELARLNKIIVVAGLDADSNQKPFTGLMELIPYAVSVTKLTSICSMCMEENNGIINLAPMTIKKIKNNDRIQVGQEDIYSVTCLKHLRS